MQLLQVHSPGYYISINIWVLFLDISIIFFCSLHALLTEVFYNCDMKHKKVFFF